MIITVGSLNEVKIESVREVLQLYDFLRESEVRGVGVNSGVTEQPKTLEETILGAKNRARDAFVGCQYAVGLESGLIPLSLDLFCNCERGEEVKRYMEHTVCAIYDGKGFSLGFSPSYEVPQRIVELMMTRGLDLSTAAREIGLTTKDYIGREEGVIGVLTEGIVDRKSYTKPAIIMALVGL